MEKTITINGRDNISLVYDMCVNLFEVHAGKKVWKQDAAYYAYVEVVTGSRNLKLILNDAQDIAVEKYNTGIGAGIRTRYSNWVYDGVEVPISYETLIWFDNTYGHLHLEFLPLNEGSIGVSKVVWPVPFEFKKDSVDDYTVLPMMQGAIIPNNWPEKIDALEPVRFYERAAYMPWWGQVEDGNGYIAIVETAWDAGYELNHPQGGPTAVNAVWHSSMGKLCYRRKMLCSFHAGCDYNDLCKEYRKYAGQHGLVVTLAEKQAGNGNLDKLIGSPIVHSGIFYHVKPSSRYYDKVNPENNNRLNTFMERAEQLKRLKSLGVEKAYLHLDGWGKMGYDNMHPDIIPPCEKAGGWQDMKVLSDTCKELGYIFAIHDQYRDYYKDAESFDESQALQDIDGKVPGECTWPGGEQAYLCTQLAPYYIKRNFEALKGYGIELKGAYLDVFGIIALEECHNKEHMMTRKENMEKRIECFEYVRSEGMVISSEEPVEWTIPYLDLVHHAPFAQVQLGEGKAKGIPVPLFNLVYHDCMVIPWGLSRGGWGLPDGESGFLYALLNGGVAYLDIEADSKQIEINRIVCELHKKIAKQEMLRHEFIDGNSKRQRTYFADGTVVEINLDTDEYVIYKICLDNEEH